jgi:hypothetical protein
MLKVFAVAAGAALLTFAPGAASAQNADDGMLCVYDAVSAAGYDAVAEAFLYGDEEEEANAALDKAAQTCSDQFKFSEGEAAAARDLGIYGVAVDYLIDELYFMDVSDAAVDGMFGVFDALGDDDLDIFFDTAWRTNVDFMARLKAQLLKAGFPDSDEELGTAYDIFEISALADEAMFSFAVEGDE